MIPIYKYLADSFSRNESLICSACICPTVSLEQVLMIDVEKKIGTYISHITWPEKQSVITDTWASESDNLEQLGILD